MIETRKGDWMQTISGRQFWPIDPRPEDVFIEDIAHALSMMCRFNGHCDRFYSWRRWRKGSVCPNKSLHR